LNTVTTMFCAFFLGTGLAICLERLSDRERRSFEIPLVSSKTRWLRGALIILATVVIFGLFHRASLEQGCLETAEVQPSGIGRYGRLAYHLILLGLLILATAIDFDCYVIPDSITLPGTLIGVFGAALIGEAQICHLWVDWATAIPQLRGPYIPDWYDKYRFLHGFAWSLAGLTTGAGLTWLARLVSSRVLGQEAMGSGDITLMAMIGSYIGWQAVTLVFLIAPLTGITFGVLIRMISGKTYLPYGPWLSIAAGIVLFTWSRLWVQTRMIFSDWISVLMLGAVGGLGFVVLLVLVQLYKSIPVRGR
jgi:leader peptidase (prepilin peptidase) / N-methyltransferase